LSGARGLHLGPARIHAHQPHRSKSDGQAITLPEELDVEIDLRDITKDPLTKTDAAKRVEVLRHRMLFIRAAIDIIEELARDLSPSKFAIIKDARGSEEHAL